MSRTKAVAFGGVVGLALALAPLSSASADDGWHNRWGHGGNWNHGSSWNHNGGNWHGSGNWGHGWNGHGGYGYYGHGGTHVGVACYGCLWPLDLVGAVVG